MALVPYNGQSPVDSLISLASPYVAKVGKKAAKKLANAGWSVVKKGNQYVCDNTGLCIGTKPSAKMAVQRPLMQTGPSTSGALVSQNVKLRNSGPRWSSAKGVVSISHKELVSVVFSSPTTNTFTSSGIPVNATSYAAFPWLASVAGSYEKYKFSSLRFTYIPVQPTSIAGRVGLCFDYDSQDALPGSRADAYATQNSIEGSVWDALNLNVRCDKLWRFTDFNTTVDAKLVNLGQIQVYSDLVVSSGLGLGDLVVEYTVQLTAPQAAAYSTQRLSNYNNLGGAAGFGANLATVVSSSGNPIFVFNAPGSYSFTFSCLGSGISGTPTFSGISGGSVNTNLLFFSITATSAMVSATWRGINPGGTFTVTGLSGLASNTTSLIWVSRIATILG